MTDISRALTSDPLMKSLTGVTPAGFGSPASASETVLIEKSRKKDRQRSPGGGPRHTLATGWEKLFYILFYVKCYPTSQLSFSVSTGLRPADGRTDLFLFWKKLSAERRFCP